MNATAKRVEAKLMLIWKPRIDKWSENRAREAEQRYATLKGLLQRKIERGQQETLDGHQGERSSPEQTPNRSTNDPSTPDVSPCPITVDSEVEVPRKRRNCKPRLHLANYDGTTSWLDHECYFSGFAEVEGWTGSEKAHFLCLSLRGVAQSVFTGMTPERKKNYSEVLKELQQHFSPKEKIFVYQAELQARRLGPEEELSELSREIREKTNLAYPEATGATLDSLRTSCFLRSLTDQKMRLSVATKHPKTLTEALAFATEYESILAADRTQGETRKKVRALKEVEEKPPEQKENTETETLKLLRELVAKQPTTNNRPSNRPPRRDKKEICCYTCGEKGHYAFECKKRAAASKKEASPPAKPEIQGTTKVSEN